MGRRTLCLIPRDVLRALREQGWTVEKRKGGHFRLTTPDGERVFIGSTPSDSRSHRNNLALLRRKGLRI